MFFKKWLSMNQNILIYAKYKVMQIFHSYKEAHTILKIPGSFQRGTIGTPDQGITSLKLTYNPKSLDRLSLDLNKIYYVGIGKKSSQGEPAANQTREDQAPFFTSLRTQKPFPILLKLKQGVVLYNGMYKVYSIQKKTTSQGFVYYQIELHRA